MCKGSSTSTSNTSYTPNAQALSAYSQLLSQAQGVASTPYQAYTGELVAPVNQQESTGISGVNQYANYSLPSTQTALGLAQSAASPITASQISQYESPYTQQVVNATQAEFNNQNAQQAQQVNSNAIAQGAMGGNRVGVAQAELANQQQLAQAPTIAGLENQGYTTGLNTALTEQQAQLSGAYGLAGIGTSGQNTLESGANQQIGAGQLEQTTQQAQDTAAYQQYLNQMAYPFQTTSYLAGIEGSIGPEMGGTGYGQTTTTQSPSVLSELLGAGSTLTGLFGSTGAIPYLSSDRRIKENIKAIGRLKDGQIVYRFNYKGDPVTRIGLMAQEVKKKHPEAVHRDDIGILYVDYDKATRDAEGVAKRQLGGGTGIGLTTQGVANLPYAASTGLPYSASNLPSSYIPATKLSGGKSFTANLPKAPSTNTNQNQPINAQQTAALGKAIFGQMNSTGATQPIGLSPEVSPLGAIYHRGGRIRHRDVGGALLDDDQIQPLQLADASPSLNSSMAPSSAMALGVAPPPATPTTSISALGVATVPTATPSYTTAEPSGDYGQNNLTSWQRAIGAIESDNDYGRLGPTTQAGDRAYGRYGVMGQNIGPWTQQVLGQAMTPREFLDSPSAQDAVFRAKFGSYVNQYGPEGAARAWYAGPGGMNNLGATSHDANGNPIGATVGGYGRQFLRNLGTAEGVPSQGATDITPQLPSQGVAAPPSALQRLFPNADFSANSKLWPALIAAGAGMMASRSPLPGVAIGEGLQAGVNEYQQEKATETAGQIKQIELQQNAQKLQREADQFALNYQVQLQKMEMDQRKELMEEMKPIQVGMGPLGPIYVVRDAKSGGYRVIDPETGQLGQLITGQGTPGTGRNPLGGSSPGVTRIPDNAPPPGGPPMPPPTRPGGLPSPAQPQTVPTTPAPQAQPAVDRLAPPSIVAVGDNRYDDAASGLRNVMQADLNSTAGLNTDSLAKMQADPYFVNHPGDLARVVQIAKGLAPIPPTSNRSYQNQYLTEKAYELNPELNATLFPMRQRAMNFFAVGTQGGGGQQFIAFNRWLSHAGRLMSLAEQLDMGPNTTWNQLKNSLARSGWGQTVGLTDDQAQRLLGEFQVEAKGVAGEGAKVLAGTHPGEMERQQWESVFSPDTPLATMRSKILGLMNMGHDAMDANVGQYNMDMGTNHSGDQFLTNRSRAVMDTMLNGGNMTDTLRRLDSGQFSSLRPQDQKALQWANSHPNDPKAASIKRALGVQ